MARGVVSLVLAAAFALTLAQSNVPPVVIMHGIIGSAEKVRDVEEWILEALPGTYVKRMEIGNGPIDSIFMHMDKQVETFCENIYADENLKEGFNLIGFSQGGLVSRGYIERCNKYPVINFLSWASPQGGQFGGLENFVPPWISVLLNAVPYGPNVQGNFSLAQYWRDPYNLADYLKNSQFLADINNERLVKNKTYADNIKSLKSMMLLYSPVDGVISPPESGWFGQFKAWTGPGKNGVIIPLQDQLQYKEDWIGLRTLDERGALYLHKSNCTHPEHPTYQCQYAFQEYSLPILSEPWTAVREFWASSGMQDRIFRK